MKSSVTRHVLRVGIVCGLAGCGHDATAPAPTLSQGYWALRANYHAVNMATVPGYNTIRLTAAPLSVTGDTLAGVGPVTFSAKDSALTVDLTGLVTAHFITDRALVIVSRQYQRITLADTIFIRITDTVPQFPLTVLSIQPQPDGLDSARTALGVNLTIPAYATNTSGNVATDTVCNVNGCPLLVDFSSSDPAIAEIDRRSGQVTSHRPGTVTFYATTYAYGVTKRDSLPFVIGWPSFITVNATWVTPVDSKTPTLTFSPANLIVSVGAHISWQDGGLGDPNPQGDSIDVIFDNPAAVQPSCGVIAGTLFCDFVPAGSGGNIAPFFPDTARLNAGDFFGYFPSAMQSRSFPTQGTYTYHSQRYPSATGKIIVTSGL